MIKNKFFNYFLILTSNFFIFEFFLRSAISLNLVQEEQIFTEEINQEMKWYKFVSTNYKNPGGKHTEFHSILKGDFLNPIKSDSEVIYEYRPFTAYQLYDYDRKIGWKNKSNFNIAPLPRYEKYTTDQDGFRITKFVELSSSKELKIKNKKKKKILILGDSFTFGSDVDNSETYPYQLQARLDKNEWEVINAGVPGYGIDQMYLSYLKYISIKGMPEVVILSFLYDNNKRNTKYFREYKKPYFNKKVPKSLEESKNIIHPKNFEPCLKYSYLYCALSSLSNKIKNKFLSSEKKNGTDISSQIFLNIKKDADKKNSKLILLSIPRSQMFYGNEKYYNYGKEIENWFSNICSSNSLNCKSFYKSISKKKENPLNYYFKKKYHFNKKGNKIAAKLLLNEILNKEN